MTTPSRPDLRVIDRAINQIRTMQNCFSCYALINSASLMDYRNKFKYTYQYRKYVWDLHGGMYPYWWNKDSWAYIEQRAAMLEAFKQACIEAGRKEAERGQESNQS